MKRKLMKSADRVVLANASLLKRIIAFLIDLFVVDVIILPLRSVLLALVTPKNSIIETVEALQATPGLVGKITTITLAVAFIAILYFSLLEAMIGQTLGKLITGIYVTQTVLNKPPRKADEQNALIRPSLFQAVLRNLFLVPLFPFALLWIIEPFTILITKRNQRLLELLSNTRTVEVFRI